MQLSFRKRFAWRIPHAVNLARLGEVVSTPFSVDLVQCCGLVEFVSNTSFSPLVFVCPRHPLSGRRRP